MQFLSVAGLTKELREQITASGIKLRKEVHKGIN